MIRLLAPTTTDSAEAGGTVIVEISQETFRALAAAVEVAFEDEASVPAEHAAAAGELWRFFVEARTS
jgi:hypothetical protein